MNLALKLLAMFENPKLKGQRKDDSKKDQKCSYSLENSCHHHYHVPILPTFAHKNGELKIDVPNVGDFKLADAIELSSGRKPQFSNAQVSQLPTPIISGGGFATMLAPPKRAARVGDSAGSGRAVSEFVPSHYDHNNIVDRKGITSRNVSNPLELKTPESSLTIPLPPIELESKISEELIYSPSMRSYFAPGPTIGTGSFSTVVQARQVSNPDIVVAIKIISVPTTDLASITNFKSYITRELSILSHMQHPCIVKLYDYNLTMNISDRDIERSFNTVSLSRSADSFTQQSSSQEELDRLLDENHLRMSNKQYYFLQFCPGGNLFQFLEQYYNVLFLESQFWTLVTRITAELIVSVSYLHSQRVVHRDIKLENILLNRKLDADTDYCSILRQQGELLTLTDFGLSKRIAFKTQLLTTKCGSQDYVSPELLMGLDYDGVLLDSWAVGVVVYAILENRLPFDAPPLEFMDASNVSPSVIKRRRARHNPSYRIAMIDWDWYRTLTLLENVRVSDSSKQLIKNLMAVVDVLLVRKEKRYSVSDLLHDKNFFWVREVVPLSILEFDRT